MRIFNGKALVKLITTIAVREARKYCYKHMGKAAKRAGAPITRAPHKRGASLSSCARYSREDIMRITNEYSVGRNLTHDQLAANDRLCTELSRTKKAVEAQLYLIKTNKKD